jgi:hypothetical protein
MFFLKTAFAGGIVCVPWRCNDSRVAKFSGHTSHGTMNVTQIFALLGHSMILGLAIFVLPESYISSAIADFVLKSQGSKEYAMSYFQQVTLRRMSEIFSHAIDAAQA